MKTIGINKLFPTYIHPQCIVSLPARSALHLGSCSYLLRRSSAIFKEVGDKPAMTREHIHMNSWEVDPNSALLLRFASTPPALFQVDQHLVWKSTYLPLNTPTPRENSFRKHVYILNKAMNLIQS